MSAQKLDALYAEYKAAAGEVAKDKARTRLIRALYHDAYPIMYYKLRAYHPDIITDAVALTAVNLDKFRGEARFSSWFFGIVANLCNRYLRQKITRNEVSLDALVEIGAEPAVEGREDNLAELAMVLDSLNPEMRQIIEMRGEGKKPEEIGKALGLTTKAVKRRIEHLRVQLGKKAKKAKASRSSIRAASVAAGADAAGGNATSTRTSARNKE